MGCKAVASGKVKRKGRASLEFYKDGKPQYYCYGYIDPMYENYPWHDTKLDDFCSYGERKGEK